MKKSKAAIILGTAAAVTTAVVTPLMVYQNRTIQATEYTFRSPKVTGALEGYRITVVADLHGEHYGKHNEKLLRMIEKQQPDLIVLPGDLTDSYAERTQTALDFAKEVVKIAPCRFTTGNHEHRLPLHQLNAFLSELEQDGIGVLRNEAEQHGAGSEHFRLIGMDCNAAKGKKLLELMRDRPSDELNILLSHKPHFAENYEASGVDLVICGHAHGGQFRLPLIGGLYAPGQGILPKYTAGMYRLGQTVMAVSRGVGNSSFPVRLGNQPELITVILRRSK